MVKGVTANNVGEHARARSDDQFQLNLDGQQITQRVAGSGFGQPKISREAIAEFQIVTNMFDITQGRSTGMQVQAISRSGTNDLRGVDLWVLPRRQPQRGRPGGEQGAAVPEPADRRHPRRPDHPRQGALLRRPTSTSGNRGTAFLAADAAAAPDLRSSRPSRSTRTISARVDYQLSSPGQLHGARAALGVRQPVPDLERHGASVDGRAAPAAIDQRLRHLDACHERAT